MSCCQKCALIRGLSWQVLHPGADVQGRNCCDHNQSIICSEYGAYDDEEIECERIKDLGIS